MNELLKNSSLNDLTKLSIKDQDPSWKNLLSRRFINYENKRECENDAKDGFWFSRRARRIVEGAAFFAGYGFLGELGFQNMDPEKYSEFANCLINLFQKIDLTPDTNFARWQMSDFFGAAYYAFWIENVPFRSAIAGISNKGLFGKENEWYEENSSLLSAVTTGTILMAYEVLQSSTINGSLDIKDMVAYMAGLGLYLGSEFIFQEYLQLKDNFKGQIIPFYREHLGNIKDNYKGKMMNISTLMKDCFEKGE